MEGPERVWSDLYGCARALWQGLPGGHRWLLAAAPQIAGEVAEVLAFPRFKGTLHLIVTDHLTPLEAALREVAPRGVLVVGQTLGGGPQLELPERSVERGDFAYREGGLLPGWTSALPLDAPRGACASASLCARLGVPVVSAAPRNLEELLRLWWSKTPHSLIHG